MKEYSEHEIAMMTNWSELRESKNVSLQQISQLTNIPVKKLASIEAHDFSVLGTETFAKGYLNSYAKILGVDSEVFIQVYRDALNVNEPLPDNHTQSLSVAGPLAPLVKKLNILHLSIGVIVIWFVAMVLMGSDDDSESGVSSEPAKQEAMSQPREKYEDSIILANSDTAIAVSGEPDAVETGASANESTDEVSIDDLDQTDSDASGSDETDEDLLVFSFTGECWLEIKDASGSVLIAELQRKGDNQRIFGQAPFEVMLGNSRVVTLALNGKVIAIEPKSGKKTLRFTVRR